MKCAGCGTPGTYHRLAEPWIFLLERADGDGRVFCPACDDRVPEDYRGAMFLVWARGHVIVHARLELDAA